MTTSLYEDLCALAPRGPKPTLKALAQAAPDVFAKYEINTALREAHFWAQAAHETGGFKYTHEIWGPTDVQKRYEGRKDLGNIEPGDGFKFRGRGIFQLTGRANYKKYGEALGIDLINNPDKAAEPETALLIACEYWSSRKINACADKDDVVAVTKKINGGTNGIADRRAHLLIAKKMWADNYENDMVPVPPKVERTMVESKQGNSALAVGALGGLGAAKEVAAQVQDASDAFEQIMGLMKNPNFLMMLVIIGLGAAIWFWRKQHMEHHGV
jgi:putative chitinase